MTTGLETHLATLARDLGDRHVDDEHLSPDGRFVARFRGPVHPSRRLVPRRWIAAAGLHFDVVGRALAGLGTGPGAVSVGPTATPPRRRFACRRAPLLWSPDGTALAGVTAGPAPPQAWIYRADADRMTVLDAAPFSTSLLGVRGGAADAMMWLPDGDLVFLAQSVSDADDDPDVVRDTGDLPGLAEATDLLAAARVTVHRTRPGDAVRRLAGPFAVCGLNADGDTVLVARIEQATDLGRLLTSGSASTSSICTDGTVSSSGPMDLPQPPAIPTQAPRPRTIARRLSADVALHGADCASEESPTVLWLTPRPDVAGSVRASFGDHTGAGAAVPPGPLWTYLPRCCVATVRLWHPRQGGPVEFATLLARIVDGLRQAVTLVRRERGAAPLVLAGHSFGAALAAAALPHLGDELRCAVLRSGAYNRTLTPAGFQLEHRNLWSAPDMYEGFTVVRTADQITVPTLLVQGAADPNDATTTVQARNFFDALRAAGVPARLLLLAGEGHVLGTAEGVLRAVREEHEWIDRWCRQTNEGNTGHEIGDGCRILGGTAGTSAARHRSAFGGAVASGPRPRPGAR